MNRTLVRTGTALLALAVATAAPAQQATPAASPAGPIPLGRLSDAAAPTAYRLDITADPARERFTGHAEIDVTLARATRSLYLHGLNLKVSKAVATGRGAPVNATYTQVDDSGVARLDFAQGLPAGRTTLVFDYDAPFMPGSEGLYHATVDGDAYAWTQFEATDARRVFPGFDEPGFKTPFTLTITAPSGAKVHTNTPEKSAAPAAAGMTRHVFAPSKPLPTYLVAMAIGPFDVIEGQVPANKVRTAPLPYRVLATKGQRARLALAASEGPKILALHEDYFGIPYPYEKLDMAASPVQSGAMENAGLIIYMDSMLLLGADAPISQRALFGAVVAHEQAHQWFGDLVTPKWWNDIWLNESFASWAGDRVGELWQPGLGTEITQLTGALGAMNTDSGSFGRPIRQEIERTTQIPSAFDGITYDKGGQVLKMAEAYLGPAKFRAGVQTHLKRFAYKNASADDFFQSMADGSGDRAIVPVFQSYVTQVGVPVVTIRTDGTGYTLTQARYRPIGVPAGAVQTWNIPFCARQGDAAHCVVMTGSGSTRLALPGPRTNGVLAIPNANGAGYYRYSMDDAGWAGLMAGADKLPAREALTAADSLWADFAAGHASFDRVMASARVLANHPEQEAALYLGERISALAQRQLDATAQANARALLATLYKPRLDALGLDPKANAYAAEPPARAQLRFNLAAAVATEAKDAGVRRTLAGAANAALAGDPAALDATYRGLALRVAVEDGNAAFARRLLDATVASQDPLFRQQAIYALGRGDPARTVAMAQDQRLRSTERLSLMLGVAQQPAGRDLLFTMFSNDLPAISAQVPAFVQPRLPSLFAGYCEASKADALGPMFANQVAKNGGALELKQAQESIRTCVALKQAKGAEVAAALAKK